MTWDNGAGSLVLHFNISPKHSEAGFVCVFIASVALLALFAVWKKRSDVRVWAGAVAGWAGDGDGG